jgi:transcriptional regulator with XRE-family HTH domain
MKISKVLDSVRTKRDVERKALANTLGISYRTLSYWLSANRHFPAYLLPALCNDLKNYEVLDLLEEESGRMAFHKKLRDYTALDVLEEKVGRIAFPIPGLSENEELAAEDMRAVQRLVKEVGEALQNLADTLADGLVEDHKLPPAFKELDDVIRECAKLKHWLRERNKADKQRSIAFVKKLK